MMKTNIQTERVISELRRGEKIVVHDNLSQISVLLSSKAFQKVVLWDLMSFPYT